MDAEYTHKLLSTVSAAATSTSRDPLVTPHAVLDKDYITIQVQKPYSGAKTVLKSEITPANC
jgi:hypothetical protein